MFIKKSGLSLFLVIIVFGLYYIFFSNITTIRETIKTVPANSLFENGEDMEDERLINFLVENLAKPIGRSRSTPVLTNKPADFNWSQMDESKTVDEILKGRTNGFYVECGASDGETYSNTLFFELKRNWTGLLVEANPAFFQSLVKKRRNAYAYNGCLSMTKKAEILSFVPQSFVGGLDQSFESQARRLAQNIDGSTKINVTCVPLYSLMLALGKKKIDCLFLDTEGGELKILKTIPYDKLDIELIVVEYIIWKGTKEENEENMIKLNNYFANLGGYTNGSIVRGNVIFKKKYF